MHAPYQRTLRAHAKLNVLLRILARDSTGYHGIETVFQRLALSDIVHVSASGKERTLHCYGPSMPAAGLGANEENLAWRAAALYADASKWETGWDLVIEKNIPVGGGLGGGSSDAAAVLRALEAICPTPIGFAALIELAGTLGADVPFFVSDASTAFAWSRGDRLLPLAPLPRMQVGLVTFDEGVHTGAAYHAVAAIRAPGGARIASVSYAPGAFHDWSSLAAIAVNDFEEAVSEMHDGVSATLPIVRAEAARLRELGAPALGMLCGSGATCFLLHPPHVHVDLSAAPGIVVHTETA